MQTVYDGYMKVIFDPQSGRLFFAGSGLGITVAEWEMMRNEIDDHLKNSGRIR